MRWTAKRKAEAINAVREGATNLPDFLFLHGISREEWDLWCQYFDTSGRKGLRATVRQRGDGAGDDAR